MIHGIEILFKYRGHFYLGQADMEVHNEFYIYAYHGPEIKIEDIDRVWVVDNNGTQETTIDDLTTMLLPPLYDMNGNVVRVGDYIASTNYEDGIVLYKVESINETTVGVKLIHDSFCCPFHNLGRDTIKYDWVVIPLK